MSSTQYLSDAATRHQVFLQRYGNGKSKEALALLNRLRRDINARLSQEPTIFQQSRLKDILADIDSMAELSFSGINRKIITDTKKLAINEANFSVQLFNKVSTVDFTLPVDAVIVSAVIQKPMNAPMVSGITIDDALRQFSIKKRKQIAQTITDGVVLGDTTPVISSKLSTMMNTIQRRQLDTLVRTVANHTSSVARSEIYEANNDLIEGYVWLATLDSSTTFICASRDQKIYKLSTDPKPPAHWGCRSTTIPKVKPQYDIGAELKGTRPAIGADGAESVSSRKGYGGWLKSQPKEFIDEAIGVERSKLFRAGKMKIGGFIDPTGRVYTLEQLERMNPIAFIE